MEQYNSTVSQKTSDHDFDIRFKPKGAMAFFAILVILGLIIWYGIYFLILHVFKPLVWLL